MELTVSKEDYLKAIAEAESEEGPVIAATLGRWLAISAPAVTLALRRLKRDKLVWVDARGRILLTKTGRALADRMRLRHHLIERMLYEMLGVEWFKVHEEAERLEHSISPDVERRLIERLGSGGLCPHGNPINKSAAERRKAGLQSLWEAAPSAPLRIAGMHERDRQLLEYFDRLGLRPNTPLVVTARNYDGTLSLALGSGPVTLAAAAAQKIWVAPVSAP
ncbi:MAG: metal-dependent transcriptional regulator [Terriglobales bacterium]